MEGCGERSRSPGAGLDGVLLAWGCCLLAAGKAGEHGPTQCWVCLVDSAQIENTGVQNPGIISLLEPGFQQSEGLKLAANANCDSKTKQLSESWER